MKSETDYQKASTAFKNVCARLNLLSFQQSEILFLIFFRISLKYIAEILHISLKQVRTQLHRISTKIQNNPDRFVFFSLIYKGGERSERSAQGGGDENMIDENLYEKLCPQCKKNIDINQLIKSEINSMTDKQIAEKNDDKLRIK